MGFIIDKFYLYARRRLTIARSFISALDALVSCMARVEGGDSCHILRQEMLALQFTSALNALSLECSVGLYRSCSVSAGFA